MGKMSCGLYGFDSKAELYLVLVSQTSVNAL